MSKTHKFNSIEVHEAKEQLLAWLKASRKNKKVSAEDLSKSFGVHQSTFTKMESQERNLSIFEFILICDEVGLSVQDGVDVFRKALSN